MKRGLVVWLLALGMTACQPVASVAPAAAPVVAPAPPPAPAASAAIWAEVPRQICTCHEDALSRVETVVQDSQLALEFKIETGNEGWHIFSVTFDPTRVAAERVTQLLEGAGALIVPAPIAH
ncbi:MAG TPA: hypothetical protein VGL99_08190 [Chloroflexota bacterium]|jgi:hypothetical protein